MRCPYCADSANRVIDSRLGRDGQEIRRRRECLECGRRFTTRERIEEVFPKVVKRDERREDYWREKIVESVRKACQKRPVSEHELDRLVDRVERAAQDIGEKEVTSRFIGERVLEELIVLDTLAAARFASVFRDFRDADDFAEFFAQIERASAAVARGEPEASGVERASDAVARSEPEARRVERTRGEDGGSGRGR